MAAAWAPQVRPHRIRAAISQPTVGASAPITSSAPTPNTEIRITGRRPKRSLSIPRNGAARNWGMAQPTSRNPTQRAAVAGSPPTSSWASRGRTGKEIDWAE